MKLIPNNITLDNIKKSNYWDLISILIWNHYSETRYQDESMIEISEQWYGQGEKGSSSHNNSWNNPNHKEKDFERTLGYILIKFKRSDYESSIFINVRNGNIQLYAVYVDKTIKKSPYFYYGTTDVINWMLENNLLKLEN